MALKPFLLVYPLQDMFQGEYPSKNEMNSKRMRVLHGPVLYATGLSDRCVSGCHFNHLAFSRFSIVYLSEFKFTQGEKLSISVVNIPDSPLQYSKVPLEVRIPPFENHWHIWSSCQIKTNNQVHFETACSENVYLL